MIRTQRVFIMVQKLCMILMPLLLLIFFIPTSHAWATPAKDYYADQFNAAIAVQNNGTLLVTETETFHFIGGPFTYIYRDLPTDKTDGISVTGASMDGSSMQSGSEAGQYEVSGNDTIKVTWHFAPINDTTHTFVLTYHVKGVLQKTTAADFLAWEALPTSYSYTIRAAKINVTYPESTQIVGKPEVISGNASLVDPPSKGLITYEAKDLDPNETIEIGIQFRPRSLIQAAPDWQIWQQQTDMYLFPCILGAIILSLLIVLGIAFYKRSYQPKGAIKKALRTTAPPDDLSPAVSGVLVKSPSKSTVTVDQVLGTLFDLANRGVLTIVEREQGAGHFYPKQPVFMIQLEAQPEDLRPYEIDLLHILFNEINKPASVPFSDVLKHQTSYPLHLNAPVQQELQQRGFLNESNEKLRARLRTLIIYLLVIGALGTLIGFFVGRAIYIWPLGFLPTGLILAGIIAMIMRAYSSALSLKGKQEVENWQAFDRYLQGIIWGSHKEEDNQDIFMNYLPYATSFGWGNQWVQHFQKQGMTTLPSWFLNFSSTDHQQQAPNPANMLAMITMLEIIHPNLYSSAGNGNFTNHVGGGGFGGGGFGGGAAGGGGSGAG
jgi:uncharacterized membrane protein YgcG